MNSCFKSRPIEVRFFEKVGPVDSNGCLPWIGAGVTQERNYGEIWYNGRKQKAHRVVWQLRRGPIPDGLWVLHKCDNPNCVNAEHLFLGTHDDNVADKVSKNRQSRGTKRPCAKLTEDAVRKIRNAIGSSRSLAHIFGVHHTVISEIRRGVLWRHVT